MLACIHSEILEFTLHLSRKILNDCGCLLHGLQMPHKGYEQSIGEHGVLKLLQFCLGLCSHHAVLRGRYRLDELCSNL